MRRRRLLLGAAVVVIAGLAVAGLLVAGRLVNRSPHGDPDPGGRILAGLRTVESAIPADAEVLQRQADEPLWDSCDGRAQTAGWDDVTVSVQFRTTQPPETLLAQVQTALSAAGWHGGNDFSTPLGPGGRWTRAGTGTPSATATLTPGTRGNGTYWELDALAPPNGQRVSGC